MESRFRRFVWLLPLLTLATGCMVAGLVGYMVDPDLSPKWGMKFYDGLTGEASITRDEWGVPHIYAENEDDLFFAIGYAQAQDRMVQLDMMVYRQKKWRFRYRH